MTDVIDAIRSFTHKKAHIQVVLRAIAEHGGWFAPHGWAQHVAGGNSFGQVCTWGDQPRNCPPKPVILFTDPARGPVFQKTDADPGIYAGPLAGHALFATLHDGLGAISINPGGPMDEGMTFDAPAFGTVWAWAQSVALEKAIAATAKDLDKRLRAFDNWGLLLDAEEDIATAPGQGGLQKPGMIFTAPDALILAQAGLGASPFVPTTLSGAELFERLDSFAIDGFVINAFGPTPALALPLERCGAIAALS